MTGSGVVAGARHCAGRILKGIVLGAIVTRTLLGGPAAAVEEPAFQSVVRYGGSRHVQSNQQGAAILRGARAVVYCDESQSA